MVNREMILPVSGLRIPSFLSEFLKNISLRAARAGIPLTYLIIRCNIIEVAQQPLIRLSHITDYAFNTLYYTGYYV